MISTYKFKQDSARRNTRARITSVFLLCLVVSLTSCGPAAPEDNPDTNVPAQESSTAAPAFSTAQPTDTAVVPDAAGALSASEVLEGVRFSLAQFPWRMEQTVTVKETQQTTTSLTEAQSSTRGYNQSVQAVGDGTVTIESIQIDALFYVKMTGSPAETYGLVNGQWTPVTQDSSLAQFVDRGAIDPARLAQIFATDFASLSAGNGIDAMTFVLAGTEVVNGVPTTLYEARGENFTYRWWIGSDGRFYKTSVEIPAATRTIFVEYDPTIHIQPPLP